MPAMPARSQPVFHQFPTHPVYDPSTPSLGLSSWPPDPNMSQLKARAPWLLYWSSRAMRPVPGLVLVLLGALLPLLELPLLLLLLLPDLTPLLLLLFFSLLRCPPACATSAVCTPPAAVAPPAVTTPGPPLLLLLPPLLLFALASAILPPPTTSTPASCLPNSTLPCPPAPLPAMRPAAPPLSSQSNALLMLPLSLLPAPLICDDCPPADLSLLILGLLSAPSSSASCSDATPLPLRCAVPAFAALPVLPPVLPVLAWLLLLLEPELEGVLGRSTMNSSTSSMAIQRCEHGMGWKGEAPLHHLHTHQPCPTQLFLVAVHS